MPKESEPLRARSSMILAIYIFVRDSSVPPGARGFSLFHADIYVSIVCFRALCSCECVWCIMVCRAHRRRHGHAFVFVPHHKSCRSCEHTQRASKEALQARHELKYTLTHTQLQHATHTRIYTIHVVERIAGIYICLR